MIDPRERAKAEYDIRIREAREAFAAEMARIRILTGGKESVFDPDIAKAQHAFDLSKESAERDYFWAIEPLARQGAEEAK